MSRPTRNKNTEPARIEALRAQLSEIWPFRKVDGQTVAQFLEQFAMMIESGLSPGMALDGLTEQQEDANFAAVLEDINQRIHSGLTISRAMSNHPDVFPTSTIMLIRAGEQGGDIGSRLRRAGQLMFRANDFAARIKTAITGPLLTAGACGLVLFFIVKTVFPKFLAMYEEMDLEFPAISKVVFTAVDIVNHPLTLLLAVLFVVVILLFRKPLGQKLFDLLLWLPWTQPMVGKILCASMCETIAFLHKDGVPLHRVMHMIVDNCPYDTHKIRLRRAKDTLVTTGSLAEAIETLYYLPPVFHSMVSVGEESGALDTLLSASQKMMEEEIDMVIEQVTTIIEPVVICVMGVCMAVLFVGMFLPIYGMLNSLGGV